MICNGKIGDMSVLIHDQSDVTHLTSPNGSIMKSGRWHFLPNAQSALVQKVHLLSDPAGQVKDRSRSTKAFRADAVAERILRNWTRMAGFAPAVC